MAQVGMTQKLGFKDRWIASKIITIHQTNFNASLVDRMNVPAVTAAVPANAKNTENWS